jgi:hypothetical protein
MKKIALMLCCMFLLAPVAGNAAALKVGDTLPADMEVSTINDAAPVKLLSLVGKDNFTAFVFMNTACAACLQEMTSMAKMAGESKKLTVIPVTVDVKGKESVERFVGTYEQFKQMNFALDPKYALATRFNFSFTPASIIVDAKGKILARTIGWNAENESAVTKIVNGK